MSLIASVVGRLINDSRGQPTVEVTLTDDAGKVATSSLPSGSSVGKYEALSVPADQAVNTINTVIGPRLLRQPLNSLQELDTILESFDTTRGNQNIGVNSTLGISLAGCRLFAQLQGQSVYKYVQSLMGIQTSRLPIPMFNVINGGKHAQNNLDFQEYMLIPLGLKNFHEQFEAGRKIFGALGQLLQEAGQDTQIGFEGGYAPNLSTNEEGIGYLVQAIEKAGYVPGADVVLGLDIAASSISSTYTVNKEAYISLFENFPLFSIEDPFSALCAQCHALTATATHQLTLTVSKNHQAAPAYTHMIQCAIHADTLPFPATAALRHTATAPAAATVRYPTP